MVSAETRNFGLNVVLGGHELWKSIVCLRGNPQTWVKKLPRGGSEDWKINCVSNKSNIL